MILSVARDHGVEGPVESKEREERGCAGQDHVDRERFTPDMVTRVTSDFDHGYQGLDPPLPPSRLLTHDWPAIGSSNGQFQI